MSPEACLQTFSSKTRVVILAMASPALTVASSRDMNLPKFIKDDERLFRLLLGDLFPSLELPIPEYGTLQVHYYAYETCQEKHVKICHAYETCQDMPRL